jgi:hypothetical protein
MRFALLRQAGATAIEIDSPSPLGMGSIHKPRGESNEVFASATIAALHDCASRP